MAAAGDAAEAAEDRRATLRESPRNASSQLRPGDVVDVDRKFAVGEGGRGTIVSKDEAGHFVVKYAGGGPQEKGVPAAALTRPGGAAGTEDFNIATRSKSAEDAGARRPSPSLSAAEHANSSLPNAGSLSALIPLGDSPHRIIQCARRTAPNQAPASR